MAHFIWPDNMCYGYKLMSPFSPRDLNYKGHISRETHMSSKMPLPSSDPYRCSIGSNQQRLWLQMRYYLCWSLSRDWTADQDWILIPALIQRKSYCWRRLQKQLQLSDLLGPPAQPSSKCSTVYLPCCGWKYVRCCFLDGHHQVAAPIHSRHVKNSQK